MTLVWKKQNELSEHPMSQEAVDSTTNFGELPLKEAMKMSPRKFVEKQERWCDRNNSETARFTKDIRKIETEPSYKFHAINTYPFEFDIKSYIAHLDCGLVSDGSLQRKMLSVMVCNGTVKKEIIKYKDKKGKEKFKAVYIRVPENERKICPSLKDGRCSYNWKHAARTNFFSEVQNEA